MPWSVVDITLALPAYVLVLLRISGLVLTAPFLGSRVLPARVRAAFAMTVAVVIFPLVRMQVPAELTLGSALVAGVGEMMIGATIGLALTVLMMGTEVGGLIVGRQAGIALANVYDPSQNAQVSIVGQVYTISFTVLFLTIGGHRAMLAALLDTYRVIPLLSFQMDETILVLLAEMLAAAFILGIRLAGPVLIALFLTGTALGVLSRTMPQLNILTVGFALRLAVGLAVAGLSIIACQDFFLDAVWNGVTLVREAFGLDPDLTHLVS